MFEILKSDLAGRIGILHTNHGTVETPAYVPVIHPVRQSIPSKTIRRMGFDLVITNAYITMRNRREEAIRQGIHKLIDFEGSVMTDSGGYQVLEYGDLDVTPEEMALFESQIGSDIAVPLDRPTGFGLTRRRAADMVRHTLRVSQETLARSADDGQIWVGPIQGGEHMDLVARSTKTLVRDGFSMLALGSPVEMMVSYEYKLLAEMIAASKMHAPASSPFHLFGAGHPLTIPFAVALGCDTFDSASYMLYAKEGRYITEDGTRRVSDMKYFSCACEVCSGFTPSELLSLEDDERISKMALHNLHCIKSEVDRVKEAIHEGRLWEYTMRKMRAHPRLAEAADVLLNCGAHFIHTTPRFKERAVFLFGSEDQFRPEVLAYHEMVRRFDSGKKYLCVTCDSQLKPAYLSREYRALRRRFDDADSVQFCQYNPILGLIPVEISDIFPASHYVMRRTAFDPEDFDQFGQTWDEFLARNGFDRIYYSKGDEFLAHFARRIPKGTRRVSLPNK